MRKLSTLIQQVRNATENEEVTAFTGIQDQEFIRYLNDAQYHIQAAIVHNHPSVFVKEKIIDALPNKEKYAIPSDCFLGNKVHNVEYSATGAEQDYYVLQSDTIKSRASGTPGFPARYIRLSGQILLAPSPQEGGKIRINYVQRLKELSLRAGKIKQDTQVVTGSVFQLPLDEDNFNTLTENFISNDYLCVVDKLGKTLVNNLEIINVSASSITVSIDALQEEDVETIPAGSYIVAGQDSSSHSSLDISIERFLISYAAWKILKRDSSIDSQEAIQELQLMEEEIIKSYALITDDVTFVPQLNTWEDWSV